MTQVDREVREGGEGRPEVDVRDIGNEPVRPAGTSRRGLGLPAEVWPSGIVQSLTNVDPRQIRTVTESQAYSGSAPGFGASTVLPTRVQLSITEPALGAVYVLEASTDLAKWTKLMARTSTGTTLAYTNTDSASYAQRFYRVVVP